MSTILEQIQEVFEPIIKVDLTEQTTLSDLHLDALDRVQLICDIEEQFKIEIDDDVAEGFQTVGEIHDYISKIVCPDSE